MADEYDVSLDTDGDVTATTDAHSGGGDEAGVYANEEYADAQHEVLHAQRGDSADEIDPRKLVRDPTLSEIRWYYRRTFARVLVDKPIDDAYKNGFDFLEADDGENGNPSEARTLIEEPDFDGPGEGWVGAHRFAEKKARRDGFSLLYLGTNESTDVDDVDLGTHLSPIDADISVNEITHLKVLTIDDLSGSASGEAHEQIQTATGLDQSNYEVRATGIVINTDINSADYRNPIGYILDGTPSQFIHRDRVQHYVWNPEVDGDYRSERDHEDYVRRWDSRESTLGAWEGDSVLIQSYDLLKGITKGNWAVMQALFRNASHMYSVELPQDADEEDLQSAEHETQNINSKSSLVMPHGYNLEQHASGNEMDPTDYYEAIFDQVCAGHEMTKSVLFGTQAGTVSGSEVDIKNYFNKVERYRSNEGERKLFEYLTRAKRMLDSRTANEFEYDGVAIDWGPLFKLDAEARINTLQTQAQALTTLIGQYVITPDEARDLLNEEWAHIDYDDLTETQKDELDRIRLATSGQGPQALMSEGEYTNAPEGEAGRPSGAQNEPESSGATPNADSFIDSIDTSFVESDDFQDRVAEAVADRIVEEETDETDREESGTE